MKIFRNLWRWFRRKVRDPVGRHLKRIGRDVEQAAREWGTSLEADLAELSSAAALAGALYLAGNREAAREVWNRVQRFTKARRDAFLRAILDALGESEGGAPE